jgi:hypothetical protein
MADLNERGQIILISAFVLAVIFVSLALVVNSAIFTENLASRGEVSGSSEALVYQHQVEQSVGEAMAFANHYNYSDASALTDSIRDSISYIGSRGGIQQARGGQLVNVSYDTHETGTRIADNASGGSTFAGNGTAPDPWQLAENVDETRNFLIRVTDKTALNSPGPSAFAVVVNETGTADTVWRLEIAADGSKVQIDVSNDTDTVSCEYAVSSNFKIDVTRGIVGGEHCSALNRVGNSGDPMWFGANIPSGSSYNITFENGHDIVGNYSMVIQGSGNPEVASNLEDSPTVGDPYYTSAIYQTTVNYTYVTPNVAYETKVQVAPGEPAS